MPGKPFIIAQIEVIFGNKNKIIKDYLKNQKVFKVLIPY